MYKEKAYGICLYKKEKNNTKILLCKSVLSNEKFGFLKGVEAQNETKEQTALREFFEESSIKVKESYLEEYFFQENKDKDIGIFLVNYKNIKNINNYFDNDILKEKYLDKENSKVQFMNIKDIPQIKKKQINIASKIIDFLENKS